MPLSTHSVQAFVSKADGIGARVLFPNALQSFARLLPISLLIIDIANFEGGISRFWAIGERIDNLLEFC